MCLNFKTRIKKRKEKKYCEEQNNKKKSYSTGAIVLKGREKRKIRVKKDEKKQRLA